MIERYSFVALTAADLHQARHFWTHVLGFRCTEERADHYFIVDAGGLRLCVDKEDGETHVLAGTDPSVGLKVDAVEATLADLKARGLGQDPPIVRTARGAFATIRDPQGRSIVLTEHD